MVERELFQVSPTFPQQSMHSSQVGRLSTLVSTVDQESANVALQQEAELLSGTFSNADFDEMTDTVLLPESENLNVFSEKELYLMNQSTAEEFSLSSGSDLNMSEQISYVYDQYLELGSPVSLWGCPMDLDVLKMDDVFQVDKADLVQSPTLAELNANDESLFDSFDCCDLGLFSENNVADAKSSKHQAASLVRSELQNTQSDLQTPHKLNQIQIVVSDDTLTKPNNLQTAQLKCDNVEIVSGSSNPVKVQAKSSPNEKLQTVPSIPLIANQKKSSLPTTSTPIKMESQSLRSQKSDVNDSSQLKKETMSLVDKDTKEEVYDSDEDDSDMDFYNSSDAESMDDDVKSYGSCATILEKKRSRYFWQYNIQSKGPKGPSMKLSGSSHKFQKNVRDSSLNSNNVDTVKYVSKSRRGDGNDLTPNPRKLFSIGLELQKLNSIIDNLKPVNELPFSARCKSRKEKNKLASRACRLKKKAQHEANKLKLFGLLQEQRFLLNSISCAKKVVKQALDNHSKLDKQMLEQIKSLASKNAFTKVAGHSAEYVNTILERVANGDSTGGLKAVAV